MNATVSNYYNYFRFFIGLSIAMSITKIDRDAVVYIMPRILDVNILRL